MSAWTRALDILGIRAEPTSSTPPAIMPPRRDASTVTTSEAVSTPDVFRALQVITTSTMQLSLDVERAGERMIETPSLIRRPSSEMTRSEWLSMIAMSLGTDGNAFCLTPRGPAGEVLSADPVNPSEVFITRKLDRIGRPATAKVYYYRSNTYTTADMCHLALMRIPGQLRGLGPIQAARLGLSANLGLNQYISTWWQQIAQPSGVLSSDQDLSLEQARAYSRMWNGLDPKTGEPMPAEDNPTRIRVTGKGLTYDPLLLKPADAMWLDAQRFNTTQVARLWGVPASLMLATIEGGSRTYANVESEWLAFTRFTLMAYLRPIEEALTDLSPRGQTVRFNLETLLRPDTLTRYQAHAIAIDKGWMSPAWVASQIEGLPAAAIPATKPAQEPANAQQ